MKVGFLVNIMLLLCFVCSQLLIWLIDGTLVNTLSELLNMQTTVFQRDPRWTQHQRRNDHQTCYGDEYTTSQHSSHNNDRWQHLVKSYNNMDRTAKGQKAQP